MDSTGSGGGYADVGHDDDELIIPYPRTRILQAPDAVVGMGRWPVRVFSLLATSWAERPGYTQAEIAELLGCSVRTVRRALAQLEEAGHVAVARTSGRGNSYEARHEALPGQQSYPQFPQGGTEANSGLRPRPTLASVRARARLNTVESTSVLENDSDLGSRTVLKPLSHVRATSEQPPSVDNHWRGQGRDLLWEALSSVLGCEPATRTERGRRNKAVRELRDAGASPADIQARARAYRALWPGCTLTATALAANWSALAAQAPEPPRMLQGDDGF